MRIAIAAVSSNRCISGVSRHAANLAACLLMRSEISAVHVLVASWEETYVGEAINRKDPRLFIHSVKLHPGTLHRNAWYYRSLPRIVEQLRADLIHFAYPSPIRAGVFACPAIVTLHDLYPFDIPSNFGFPKVIFNRLILRRCLQNASAIACVSESTRQRVNEIMPGMSPKAVTIFNCVENGPPPRKPSFVANWTDEPFLLCVAQHRLNKNVLLALRVFRRVLASEVAPKLRFVLIGLPGPESAKIRSFVKAADLEKRVSFIDGISDAELNWCYRNCELLLAPSSIEGFGLPVAEAQLAGCRVVCSDIPAFREVGSNKCTFVALDSDAEDQFVAKVSASLCLQRPLPDWLPHLAPSTISRQYLQLYQRVVFGPESKSGRVASRPLAQTDPSVSSKLRTAAQS
jgi:glycosyltransferase involved in cell wall biosynthesis